jgi:hypothetical protein
MLRVDESNRGKMARCPKCNMINAIPGEAQEPPSEPYEAWPRPVEPAPTTYLPKDVGVWSMRGVDGTTYGPVRFEELQRWYAEGRINNRCHVRREGETEWLPALDVLTAGQQVGETRVYSPMPSPPEFGTRPLAPHNGTAILVLACIGAIVPVCALIAAIMGHYELKRIRQGLVDPSGESTVRAGYVIGIIFSILGLFFCSCCCFNPFMFNQNMPDFMD